MYKILANQGFKTNHVHYLPSCHSTNEVAHDLLLTGATEGTIAITDNQFAGKGQAANTWQSELGLNLTFSLILRPQFLIPNQQFYITVAASLALKDVLEEELPGEIVIKWPNDIYFKNRKIAGLLIENALRGRSFESCIVGLGLNVNQTTFSEGIIATSLMKEVKKQFDLNELLNRIVTSISYFYDKLREGRYSPLLEQYHACLLGIDEERNFKSADGEFRGIIKGTDEYGRLLIENKGKTISYQHKEVQMLF